MANWTKENLIEYRMQKGWEPLSNDQIDKVLAILIEADETDRSLDDVSWAEPDIRFSVANSGNNESG